MAERNMNDDFVYRNQVDTAIDQLRLALKTADTGADPAAERRFAEHGQCDRAARPIQRGRHAAALTRIGTAHPGYHGDNA